MKEKKFNLIMSAITCVLGIIVLIVVSFAWYATNDLAKASGLTVSTSSDNLAINSYYYEAYYDGTTVTYKRDHNYKAPTSMPIYDPLFSDGSNCIVLELQLTALETNCEAVLNVACNNADYSTTYPIDGKENYTSNIISVCDMSQPNVSGVNYSHTLGSESDSFVPFVDGILSAEKKMLMSFENLAVTTAGNTYYFLLYYNQQAITYFYAANLEHANLTEEEVVFTNDIFFSVKEV